MIKIKKGETFTVGEFIVEKCRFKRASDVIYQVVKVVPEVGSMELMNWETKIIIYANMDCHHSQGSRYTVLTYRLPHMTLLYGKEE